MTSWQDLVITVASVGFTYFLIHQVIHGYRIKRCTISPSAAAITAIGLIAMSVAYISMSLTLSFAMSIANGLLWGILMAQALIYGDPLIQVYDSLPSSSACQSDSTVRSSSSMSSASSGSNTSRASSTDYSTAPTSSSSTSSRSTTKK